MGRIPSFDFMVKTNREEINVHFPCYVPVFRYNVRYCNQPSSEKPTWEQQMMDIILDRRLYVPIFTDQTFAAKYIGDMDYCGVAVTVEFLLPEDIRDCFGRRQKMGLSHDLLFDPRRGYEGWRVLLSDFPTSDFP